MFSNSKFLPRVCAREQILAFFDNQPENFHTVCTWMREGPMGKEGGEQARRPVRAEKT